MCCLHCIKTTAASRSRNGMWSVQFSSCSPFFLLASTAAAASRTAVYSLSILSNNKKKGDTRRGWCACTLYWSRRSCVISKRLPSWLNLLPPLWYVARRFFPISTHWTFLLFIGQDWALLPLLYIAKKFKQNGLLNTVLLKTRIFSFSFKFNSWKEFAFFIF